MELQRHLYEYLATEFTHVSTGIKDSTDIATAAYNFSACHGAITRVVNLEYNNDLVHLFFVFNGCYSTVINRLTKLSQNAELQVQFPAEFSEKLAGIIEAFAERFHKQSDFSDLIPPLTNLCYVVTGNGQFLYQTGRLVI